MTAYNLSYIIATRNRLPFLKITLSRLIYKRLPDEEIVVVDGNSNDGSKEFLQGLFDEGKINQFISEPDKNQAHGWNKAMLMATGTIIKKIIDDDVFCYEAIRECKNFMLQNTTVDVLLSNDLASGLSNHQNVQQCSRLMQFEKWKGGLMPSFTFGDVHILIRRTSLAYIGLYNASFVMMDWEYSLRISYLKANIAYYTGYNALSVDHAQTISSLKDRMLIEEQGKRGSLFYEYAGDTAEISAWSKIKIGAGKLLKPAKNEEAKQSPIINIDAAYAFYYEYIRDINKGQVFKFLTKN